jgi:hypothetical protein
LTGRAKSQADGVPTLSIGWATQQNVGGYLNLAIASNGPAGVIRNTDDVEGHLKIVASKGELKRVAKNGMTSNNWSVSISGGDSGS